MGFLLKILPNEIFYSWVSRMYAISGMKPSIFLFGFIGTSKLDIHQIKQLKEKVNKDVFMEILNKHSVLVVMKPFMLKEKYEKTVTNLLDRKMCEITWNREIKVCPCCYKEDIERFGQAYLRIDHQVYGNLLCNKHHVDLIVPKQYVGGSTQKLFKSNLLENELTETCEYNTLLHQQISYMIHLICNNLILKEMDLEKIQKKYNARIKELGYYNGRIEQKRLTKAITDYYGEVTLKELDPQIILYDRWNWINLAISQKNGAKVIHHILMIKFLFGSIENLIKYDIEKNNDSEPFGNGPWKCQNPVCIHYNKEVILEGIIKETRKRKIYEGVWKCPYCGYTYMKKSTYEENDKVIIDYGPLWRKVFVAKYKTHKKPLAQLAKEMGCNISVITRMKKELVIDEYNQDNKINEEKIEEYKKVIIEYIHTYPDCTRSTILKENYTAYKVLKKYASEWCNRNLPNVDFCRMSEEDREKIWNKRDVEIAKQIEELAIEIDRTGGPRRKSRLMFAEKLKCNWIRYKASLDKMPLAKAMLDKYCNTKTKNVIN